MSTDDDAKKDPPEAAEVPESEPAASAEAASREEEASEDDASDDGESSKVEAAARSKRGGKSSKKAARQEERRAAEARAKSGVTSSQAVVYALVALTAGAAAGWFGHIAQAKAKLRADSSAPAASGSAAPAGPCGAWEKKICSGAGEQSAACQQAKGATGLLTTATCEVALEVVPASLAKVKAERASCDTLVTKLCKDLPEGSAACALVKERTQMFPPERCREFLQNYDAVLGELKMLDQQAAMQGGPGAPHGMPPGAQPGMPPGAQPGMPPGASPDPQ
jgi:hypothetical protein